MTELAEDRPKDFKPPPLGPVIAVALELGMLSVFIMNRSIGGMVLWAGYFWFSATCSFLFSRREP